MKFRKLAITAALILASGLSAIYAQDAIDRYFSKYADDSRFTTIVISSKMFELFADLDIEDPDSKDVQETLKGLKGIRILAYDQSEDEKALPTNFKSEVNKLGKEYELLMSVDENDEKVRFFVRESGDTIAELFMIVGGQGNLFLMSLVGDIDLSKVSKLSKNLNIGGMDYLDNLDENPKGE